MKKHWLSPFLREAKWLRVEKYVKKKNKINCINLLR